MFSKKEKELGIEVEILKTNIKEKYKKIMSKMEIIEESGVDIIVVEQRCKHNDLWNMLYELESSKTNNTGFFMFDKEMSKTMEKIDVISSEPKLTGCIQKISKKNGSKTNILKRKPIVDSDIVFLDKIIEENKLFLESQRKTNLKLSSKYKNIQRKISEIEIKEEKKSKMLIECKKDILRIKAKTSERERINDLEKDFKTFIRYITKQTDIFSTQIRKIKKKQNWMIMFLKMMNMVH